MSIERLILRVTFCKCLKDNDVTIPINSHLPITYADGQVNCKTILLLFL